MKYSKLPTFLFLSLCYAQVTLAAPQPNKSIGAESSESYSIKSIYENLVKIFMMFVDIIAAFSIFLGILYIIYGIVNIRNIEAGRKQGDSTDQLKGIFISLFLINVIFWGFFGMDLVKNWLSG